MTTYFYQYMPICVLNEGRDGRKNRNIQTAGSVSNRVKHYYYYYIMIYLITGNLCNNFFGDLI